MRRRVGEMSPARDATLTPKARRGTGLGRTSAPYVSVPIYHHKDEYTNNTKLRSKRARVCLFGARWAANYIHMRATGQWHMARVA